MDILILGNGFDLAHDLKTSYKDFLSFCQNSTNNFCYHECYEKNLWMKHFISKQNILGEKWIDLEKEIYYVIQRLNIRNFLYPQVLTLNMTDKEFFIDKMELREPYYNEKLSKDGLVEEFYSYIINFYFENKNDLIHLLYKQLREFTKTFEQYLKEIVMPNINKSKKYSLQINRGCISLLNFNYTDTCERLYKINFNSNNWGIKTKAVYVHGKINNEDDCNLVLGTHNFDNKQIPVEFNIFKKHHQRHRYGTIDSYQELLNELKYPTKIYTPIFHIIGHSLDETDHSILRHILLANKKSVIKIYYHDEEALARMQSNIDLIIGEEEVMAKVRFIKQNNPERGILVPLKQEKIQMA